MPFVWSRIFRVVQQPTHLQMYEVIPEIVIPEIVPEVIAEEVVEEETE